jgi:polyhydroxyalkanoate synthesis regulator phasin
MKKTLLIAAIALIITASTVSLVDAQMRNKENLNRPEFTEEMKAEIETRRAEMENQRTEIQNIMENGTYAQWKEMMDSRPRITDYITEENFTQFQKAHKLKQAGNYEEAQKIIAELGIESKFGIMGKGMYNRPRGMRPMNGECPFQK